MKTRIYLLAIVFLGFSLVSCKKDPLPTDTETVPVFSFTGEVDGITTTINAGQNDYYMYSSTATDGNSLKTFTANLTKTTNQNGPNSLKITFIDYAFSNPTETQMDSSLYLGFYNYATTSGAASRYSVAYTKTTIGPIVTGINWTFGDGTSKIELNPIHTYVRPGNYDYCMDATFLGGCTSSLCNTVHLGNIGNFCETNMGVSNPTGTSFNFSSNGTSGEAPYTYLWNFGDGSTSQDQNPNHSYSAEGVYTVAVTVTDNSGVSETTRQNIRTENSTDCVARHSHAVTPIANPNNFGNVIIEWTDANGTVYTSKNDAQPLRSFFKINSIEEYVVNENNQTTKKLNVSFSCTLYNGGSSILIKNAHAVISVAY